MMNRDQAEGHVLVNSFPVLWKHLAHGAKLDASLGRSMPSIAVGGSSEAAQQAARQRMLHDRQP